MEGVCARLVGDLGLDLRPQELAVRWGDFFFRKIGVSANGRFRSLYACECESLCETLGALGRAVEPNPYVDDLRAYWRCPELHAEVHDVLGRLDVPVCIVSNVDRADLEAALRTHGLDVAETVTSDDARCYKPAAGVFELALARTGWARERVVHVGDSLHSDVAGARACGLRTAWISRANRIYDIGTDPPDHQFADLRGLLELSRG